MSNSLQLHGRYPARLLCPWDSPGKNTGVGCHFLLQGISPTQVLNLGLPHYRQILYHLSHQGSPRAWQGTIIFNQSTGLETIQEHSKNLAPRSRLEVEAWSLAQIQLLQIEDKDQETAEKNTQDMDFLSPRVTLLQILEWHQDSLYCLWLNPAALPEAVAGAALCLPRNCSV